jgi:hypothetical protein
LGSCSKKITQSFIYSPDDLLITEGIRPEGYKSPCRDPLNYVPNYDRIEDSYEKYVKVYVHFMDSTSRKYNIPKEDGEKWAIDMIENANMRLKKNVQMNLPEGNNTPVIPANYQYVLTKDEDGEICTYHYDNDLYYMLTKGKGANNYSQGVIMKYAKNEDNLLNLFILPPHPDSIATGRYNPLRSGISMGNSVKLTGPVSSGMKPWEMATGVNHEVGHTFGLGHSWYAKDGCDDTPPNPNCWAATTDGKCKGPTSNNMMDYNASQMAITPCQLGKINLVMSDENTKRRGLLMKTWCQLDESKTIVVSDNRIWEAYKDIQNNVIIEDGGVLTICCRTSFPKDASITVKPGGELVLIDAKLHNDCGEKWQGIILESKGKKSGKVTKVGRVKIEDVSNEALPNANNQ